MKRLITALAAAALGVALWAPNAFAAETEPTRDLLLPDWGMSVSVGGGVVGFSEGVLHDYAEPGGTWDARVALGTRRTIGYELAYIGAAQNIDALGLDKNAILLGTTVEANVKANVYKAQFGASAFSPYVLAGAGYKRYDLQADTNTSAVKDSDNLLEIPVGIGLNYQYRRAIVDLRGVFRPAFFGDMVEQTDSNMDNFTTTLHVGFEF